MNNIPVLTEKTISKLEKSLRKLIQAKYHKTGLPFVTLKFAQTLDGKIATLTGDSKWISGLSSLRFAHQLRSFHDAVLVGVGTIIRDDPQLTVRLINGSTSLTIFEGKNPKKIIVDSQLRTPLYSNILNGKAALSTIIVTTSLANPKRVERYRSKGAEVWVTKKDRSDRVELQNLLEELGQKGIRSALVEGGSKIITAFLRNRLSDHLVVVIAPKIIGKGINCVSVSTSLGFKNPLSFSSLKFFRLGDDVILDAIIRKNH